MVTMTEKGIGEKEIEVRVARMFEAPAAEVFAAWLDPDAIGKWMFGPALREEQVLRISVDPKVGGQFSFVVLRGGAEIDHLGEYQQIEPPTDSATGRLAFTWSTRDSLPDYSRVAVEVTPSGSGSEVVVTHELHPSWADYAERTKIAWELMTDVLAALLEPPGSEKPAASSASRTAPHRRI